jgi:hypothetical protein
MFARAQPVRCEAIHLTMDKDNRWGPLFNTIKIAVTPFQRVRVKTHHGTYRECMYALQTFGIPAQDIPIRHVHWTSAETGETGTTLVVQTDQHTEMMTKRRERERREKAAWKAKLASEASLANYWNKQQQMHHPQHYDQLDDDDDDSESLTTMDDDDAFMPIPIDETRVLLYNANSCLYSSVNTVSRTDPPSSAAASTIQMIDTSDRCSDLSECTAINREGLAHNNPNLSMITPPLPPRSIHVQSSDQGTKSGTKKCTKTTPVVPPRPVSLSKILPSSPPSWGTVGKEPRSKRTVPESHGKRVGIPSRNDVLFGRGKGFQNHIGNLKYRQMIEDCQNTYELANKEQKTRIAEEIIDFILLQAEGRFLKDMDGSGWRIVSDPVALRQKVAHAFRGLRDRKDKEQVQQQQSEDGTIHEKPKRRSKTTKQQTNSTIATQLSTGSTRQVSRQRSRPESDISSSDGEDQDYFHVQAIPSSSDETTKRSKTALF